MSRVDSPAPRRAVISWGLLGLMALLGVPLGLGLYTFWYGEGASYMSNDPKACVNCHIMRDEYDSWQKSSHHAHAVCNDCHTPHDFLGKYASKARNGFWHSKGFTFQDFHEPIQITEYNRAILIENCRKCHADFVHEANTPAGHWGESSLDCLHCHAHVGHSVR